MLEALRNKVIENSNKEMEKQIEHLQNKEYHTLRNNLTALRWEQLQNGTITREKACEIAEKKIRKEAAKDLQNELAKIDRAENAKDFTGCTINIEWKRSSTWGRNPKAQLSGCGYYTSESIGGCGYDKESTAVAQVLNQCISLLKLLYVAKNEELQKNENGTSHNALGYGSGYGVLPYFEGGVGVSCFDSICRRLGLTWKHVGWGSTYDVYEISKEA